MFRTLFAASAALALAAASSPASIDPRGVFLHNYSGPFSGWEWIQIVDQPGDRRYEFSDLRGAVPYRGSIADDGTTIWDTTGTTGGSGVFANEHRATFDLVFGASTFTSDIWRAPFTDADFITSIESREAGDTALAGSWDVTVQTVDPRTGGVTTANTDTLGVEVSDDLMRLTVGSSGVSYQGVFESPGRVGFRVQRRGNVPDAFKTYDGSAYSVNANLLGDLRVTGADSFEAVLLTENRGNGGNLNPEQIRLLATRVPAPGGPALVAAGVLLAARRRR